MSPEHVPVTVTCRPGLAGGCAVLEVPVVRLSAGGPLQLGCSCCSGWGGVVRLVPQSALGDGDGGIGLVVLLRAKAGSGFWYPSWISVPLIRQDQAPVVEPPKA